MINLFILPLADPQAILENVGGKGASLARLATAGLHVPGGFHVTTEAYRQFVAANNLQSHILAALEPVDSTQPDTLETASQVIYQRFTQAAIPSPIADAITHAYLDMSTQPVAVAVRSSATAEDLPDASFAGQQETFLNISGKEAVLEAVKKCWASLWTARTISYRARQNIDPQSVALAVVVQELVFADAAGILFTANPINGNRSEVVINAAWGLGEAIVGGRVTPDTLTIEKSNGRILKSEIAEKQVMTVRTAAGTEEHPVPASQRQQAVLTDNQAADLFQLAVQIENLYGMPMDIEWALAEGKFAILQARPITALPEYIDKTKIEWKKLHPKGIYMRGSVVDLLPDPVSPLFATMGIPGIIAGVARAGGILTRRKVHTADDYFTTINYYAYMDAYMPPAAWWWAITGLIPSYPRMLRDMVPFWRNKVRPEYIALVDEKKDLQLDQLTPAELWQNIQEIIDVAMYYTGTLMFATMGASAGSEAMAKWAYNKFAKREGDPPGPTLVMGYNSIPVQAEKSLYDLAMWSARQPELKAFLLNTPSVKLVEYGSAETTDFSPPEGWQEFQTRFHTHMENFGYIIFELDFAKSLPLDHPEPMLETIKMYLSGEGVNPHERQHASEEKRLQTTQMARSRVKGLKRWILNIALNWGQSMAEVREDALADIGLGYPLLRRMLRELGSRLGQAGAIQEREDIFWLEKNEIDQGVAMHEAGQPVDNWAELVRHRKAFWKTVKQITPPPMIPPRKRVMGIKTDIYVAASESDQMEDLLIGVGASAGKKTAPARVLHGPQDFDQMRPGEVLVAGTTTPAWTPLFAMASAVVTDIGGPLSHGSIVAREYGIPAVMGTGVATRRIQNGQMITVDGSAGTVTLSQNEA